METLSGRYPMVFSAWGLLLPAAVAAFVVVPRLLVPARVARWDDPWRADWERAHGRSLEHFRHRLTRLLRATRLTRWVVVAFLGLALVLDLEYVRTTWPAGTLVGGLLFYPLLTFTSLVLVVLLLLLVGEQVTSLKIQKVDELTRR